MPKKTILLAAGIFAVAIVSSGVYVRIFISREKSPEVAISEGNSSGGSFGSYHTDLGNERKLVGSVHNIFVGKVISQVGYQQRQASTQIRYSVSLLLNIKGHLSRGVVVNLHPGGSGLQLGATYLFAARYEQENNWYNISAPEFDRKLITQDMNLSDIQLKNLARNNEKVKTLEAAYPNEILFDIDVKYHTTYNSYASRRFDANGELIDDTVELRKQLEAANAAIAPAPSESVPPSPTPEASPSEEGTPLAS